MRLMYEKNMKKYLTDILAIILVASVAVIAAERPKTDYQEKFSQNVMVQEKTEKKDHITDTISSQLRRYQYVEERNVFAMDGSYVTTTGLKPMPENPYVLVAILKGREKTAIFKEYSGSMISLKVGQKLIDGAIITEIGNLSVKVKKGMKIREYRIFDIRAQKE